METHLHPVKTGNDSVFWTATPYAVAAISVGVVGITVAVTQTATVAIVAGAILAVLGTAIFYGVVMCAICSSNSDDFGQNLGKFVATSAAFAVAELIGTIARLIIFDLIVHALHGKK